MAAIGNIDGNVFENLTKGIHDFDEIELVRLHEAADIVQEVLKSADARQQRKMAASFRQIG